MPTLQLTNDGRLVYHQTAYEERKAFLGYDLGLLAKS